MDSLTFQELILTNEEIEIILSVPNHPEFTAEQIEILERELYSRLGLRHINP